MRHKVSSNPNPYEEIPTMNTFQPPPRDAVHLRDRRSDTSCSSTVTGPCSTCPTESERDSTLTDGSWSEQSSTVSESTVQNRRLLPPKPEPPRRYEPQATTSGTESLESQSAELLRQQPTGTVPTGACSDAVHSLAEPASCSSTVFGRSPPQTPSQTSTEDLFPITDSGPQNP
ncbi:hypothetical protein OSTOST_25571 [Ostertagia ostertagi]